MARELSRVFCIFAVENTFDVTGIRQPENPGNVVKRRPDSFLPGMAIFKPFSGTFGFGWYNLSFLPGNAVKSKIREN